MKCASPNLDVARLPLCCFSCRKKKMAGWQSGVKVFWSEEKVCNWGPWAGSLHCTSRRIIAWGYKKKKKCFFKEGGFFSVCQITAFPFLPFCLPSYFKTQLDLLIDSLNAVAAIGRLLCRHYWDQFQFTPLPSQQGMQFLSVFCSIITIRGA